MGRWGIRSLETRVGRESSRGGARLHSGGIHVGEFEEGVTVIRQGGSFKSESCREL